MYGTPFCTRQIIDLHVRCDFSLIFLAKKVVGHASNNRFARTMRLLINFLSQKSGQAMAGLAGPAATPMQVAT